MNVSVCSLVLLRFSLSPKIPVSISTTFRPHKVNPMASLCALRGRAMAMKESMMPAVEWFTTALEIDPRCMVALQCLIDWHLLPPNKQMSLLMR